MNAFWLALAAAQAAPAAPEGYRASGNAPSPWSLTVANGRMVFETPVRAPISIAIPAAQTSDGITEYRSGKLHVSIHRGGPLCEGADEQSYRDSVFVMVGRAEYAGCGGAPLPIDWLDGTSWHFTEIAGEDTGLTGDIFRDDRYAVDFGADTMVGYSGCNRFSAGYVRADGTLTTRPPFGSTRGGCSEAVMNRERRLFEILGQPMRISFPDRNTMVLTGESGTLQLRRARDQD